MLPHKDLVPHHDKVTWLFVTRNFKEDAKDREAMRTHDRFGISSWPQLVLFDPRDDRVLEWMSRSLPRFKAQLLKHQDAVPKPSAAAKAKWQRFEKLHAALEQGESGRKLRATFRELAEKPDELGIWLAARETLRELAPPKRSWQQRLEDPDVRERALVLEELAMISDAEIHERMTAAAMERLFDAEEHLVVKIRALALLKPHEGAAIAARCAPLLRIPNDPLRYEVLALLAKHPQQELAAPLAELYAGAGKTIPSRNPNVLRARVATALAGSGDARAIDAIAEFLRDVLPNNGTRNASLQALAGIAERCSAKDKKRIVEIVFANFPGPLDEPRYAFFGEKRLRRALPHIARQVHGALVQITGNQQLPSPPDEWDADARDRYLSELSKKL